MISGHVGWQPMKLIFGKIHPKYPKLAGIILPHEGSWRDDGTEVCAMTVVSSRKHNQNPHYDCYFYHLIKL